MLSTSLPEQRNDPVEKLTDQLETSALDDRSYRAIRLPNRLEVLLVHDAKTHKASAAMDVNVGNFSDEEGMPGTAHAVEHLLFMGTKKYPIENAYSQYISSNAGSYNAYTGATSTNYYFEVAAKPAEDATPEEPSPLYGALDRFAQFFINPLFLKSALDRELRAVDSENNQNLQSDQRRLHQLEKSLSNPKHPYHYFATGNFEVLKTQPEARGVDVRQKFMDFHEKHYSANRMKLVILGRESLDVLEKWAANIFAGVRDKDLPQNRWESEVPFPKEYLSTQCLVKPVMDLRNLILTFPFIEEELLFESQPSRHICHLIGHEGPGSIMSYVKSKGWVRSLAAGVNPVCAGTPSIFTCLIRLTEDGLKNYKEIVKIFFQYVSLLQESPPREWIFQEQQQLTDIAFKFQQKTHASRFTSEISAIMQTPLPRQWLLSGSRLRKFDPVKIKECLSCLRADNFRMTVVSQKFPGTWESKEKWYGTEYTYGQIPADFVAEIKRAAQSTYENRPSELHLPHKNELIPTNLEVEKKEIEEPAVSPKLIGSNNFARTWHKKDDTFWVPKANFFVNCRNRLVYATAENHLKVYLYIEMVSDALQEYVYNDHLAGLNYSISINSIGIEIKVSGYNDKLPVLLEKVLITMRELEVKPDRFDIIKEAYTRGLKNWDFQKPYNQVETFTTWLNTENGYINEELLAELEHLTAADIQQFYPQLLHQMHIETLAHGNLSEEDALKLSDLIETTLKPRVLPQTQWHIPRSLVFPPGSNYIYHKTLKDPANVNHCIEYVLFVGDKSERQLRAKTLLLQQMIQEPAFDQLRTKEQLGYAVFSGARKAETTIGYRVIIQSKKTPEYLDSRIDSFLDGFSKTLAAMLDTEFEGHKRSLITKRLEKLNNLDEESRRLWKHIESGYFDFELNQQDATNIKLLTKADMIAYYAFFILPSSPTRAKLAIYLNAQTRSTDAVENGLKTLALNKDKTNEEDGEVLVKTDGNCTTPVIITEVGQFKSELPVSAGPQPVKPISAFE